jgi:hypothetical protein
MNLDGTTKPERATRSLGTLLLTATLAAGLPAHVQAECATDTALPATCDWAVVSANPSGSRTRVAHDAVIDGSICGQNITIDGATVGGDVVTTMPSAASIVLKAEASVGGSVVNPTRSDPIEPGTALGDCAEAADQLGPSTVGLDSSALRSTEAAGDVRIAYHGNLTLTATGPINVIDFGNLTVEESGTITLDGGAIPGVTFVLRVDGRLTMKTASSIVLASGAAPERVILFGKDDCRFARDVTGEGSVFCPNASIRMDAGTRWTGAIVGGGDRIDLRHHVEITHVASEVPAL